MLTRYSLFYRIRTLKSKSSIFNYIHKKIKPKGKGETENLLNLRSLNRRLKHFQLEWLRWLRTTTKRRRRFRIDVLEKCGRSSALVESTAQFQCQPSWLSWVTGLMLRVEAIQRQERFGSRGHALSLPSWIKQFDCTQVWVFRWVPCIQSICSSRGKTRIRD